MADLGYAWEKFGNAVHALAGHGSLQDRIHSAFMCFHPIRVDDFANDPELQNDYKEIMDRLTAVDGAPGEGRVPATLKQMSDEEAAHVAELDCIRSR